MRAETKRLLTDAQTFKLTSCDRRSSDSARSRQHAQLALRRQLTCSRIDSASSGARARVSHPQRRALVCENHMHIFSVFLLEFFSKCSGCAAGARLRTLWESRRGGVGIASRCKEERRMGSACIRALDLQPALEQLGCCQHQQSWLRYITRTWPCRCWLGLLASFREPLSLLLSPPSIRPVPGPIHASLLDRASDLFVGVSRNNLLLCHRRAGKPRLCVGRECDTITLAL